MDLILTKNHEHTLRYIAYFLNAQVEFLNEVFADLAFLDSYKTKFYTGVRFAIHKTKVFYLVNQKLYFKINLILFFLYLKLQIFTHSICKDDETKAKNPECLLSSVNMSTPLTESTYLDHLSLQNHSSHCLAYTFSSTDFPGSPIGVAWLAKDDARLQSGYCAKHEWHKNALMSLNTGLVTNVNQGRRLPLLTTQLTFAHEVGHSFGAQHDPEKSGEDDECSPGDAKGGNYLMYYSTMIGRLRNNRNFSQCSRRMMGPIMHRVAQDTEKFCFKSK